MSNGTELITQLIFLFPVPVNLILSNSLKKAGNAIQVGANPLWLPLQNKLNI